MAYQRWFKTVRDQQGNAINGASCTVYEVGTSAIATVYDPNSDDSSPSPLSNPFVTTANGRFGFAAIDGEYDVVIQGGSLATQQFRVLLNGGASESGVNLRYFGTVGDGVASDLVAIQDAIAYAKATGSKLVANTEDVYFVGDFPATTLTKFLIDFDGFYFETNNCTFTMTANIATGGGGKILFSILDASDCYIGDMRIISDEVETIGSQCGVQGISIAAVSKDLSNFRFGRVAGTKLVATLAVGSYSIGTYSVSNIKFVNISNISGYYTVNCAGAGDDLTGDITSDDGVRSYFVYGVHGHHVNIFSSNHNKFTDVLIKRYTTDTSDIYVNYYCSLDNSADSAISIEHQNDTQDGVIKNVRINFNVTKLSVSWPVVNFSQFNNAGVVQSTTTSITDGVHISGNTNANVPIQMLTTCTGTNGICINRLYIERHLTIGLYDFKRFIVYIDGKRTARGNATSMNMIFNMSDQRSISTFGRLTVYGFNNQAAGNTDYILREYLVNFAIDSVGTVTNYTQTTIATQTNGGLAPTITFASSSNTCDFQVAVNNFVNATRQCEASFEVFTPV